MSLYYVNDHLITEEKQSDNTWPSGEAYERFMIRTTPMATRKTDDGKKFESYTRPICAYHSSLDPMANTRISSVKVPDKNAARITIRSSLNTRYDSDVFIVALPYEGLIVPMKNHDDQALQIYKTMILKSDQMSIEHEDRKYKRVAYFVVRPNYNAIGVDGWYSQDADLEVTFAHSNKTRKDQDTSNNEWTFKTVRVHFGTNGQYEITSEETKAPYDSFNPDDVHNVPICKLVQPTVPSNNYRPA